MEDVGVAKILLSQNGINIDKQDEFGNTAAHLAFINESLGEK